jgi:hypothetical protein
MRQDHKQTQAEIRTPKRSNQGEASPVTMKKSLITSQRTIEQARECQSRTNTSRNKQNNKPDHENKGPLTPPFTYMNKYI